MTSDKFDDEHGGSLPLMIPYEPLSDEEDDDDSDLSFPDDPLYNDSGWASECLHDSEDIDFEFVYALHTFVATVEGQANATKGDTMVLLDDSNSYWWLVRVVKDSSIGTLVTCPCSEGGASTDIGWGQDTYLPSTLRRLRSV
jgi:hypothetical protein